MFKTSIIKIRILINDTNKKETEKEIFKPPSNRKRLPKRYAPHHKNFYQLDIYRY